MLLSFFAVVALVCTGFRLERNSRLESADAGRAVPDAESITAAVRGPADLRRCIAASVVVAEAAITGARALVPVHVGRIVVRANVNGAKTARDGQMALVDRAVVAVKLRLRP